MEYQWDFSVVWRHADLLLLGLLGTLKVTATALGLGLPLGLTVALLRLSRARAVSFPAGICGVSGAIMGSGFMASSFT